MSERIALVGSCSFPSPELVREYVRALPAGVTVVSGGAKGVDTWAEEAAKACDLETLIFHADWEMLGRSAGPIRNEQIINHADRVVAFWNGVSRGTLNSILHACYAGIPIETIDANGNQIGLSEALARAEKNGAFQSWAKGRERSGKDAPDTIDALLGRISGGRGGSCDT